MPLRVWSNKPDSFACVIGRKVEREDIAQTVKGECKYVQDSSFIFAYS